VPQCRNMRRGFNTEGMKDVIGTHPAKFLLDFFLLRGGLRAKHVVGSALDGAKFNHCKDKAFMSKNNDSLRRGYQRRNLLSLVSLNEEAKSGTGITPRFSFHEATAQSVFTDQQLHAINSSVISRVPKIFDT
jgi:hypothetical protein